MEEEKQFSTRDKIIIGVIVGSVAMAIMLWGAQIFGGAECFNGVAC